MTALSPQQKIKRAKDLREQGLGYQQIGDRLGCSRSMAWDYVNRLRKLDPIECYVCGKTFTPSHGNQKTCCGESARKRFHADQHRASCGQCGATRGEGSGYPNGTKTDLCVECARDNARSRSLHFIGLREEGLTNVEIARREGVGANTVATVFNRAHRYGLTVPPPPYWSRGVAGEQVPA